MTGQDGPTSFADVNAVLEHFHARIQRVLGGRFLGMYGVGSLALGDFDPSSSDIDYIVVTDAGLDDALVRGLQAAHEQFAVGGSPWAAKVEAVYVPQAALCAHPPEEAYPQLEQGTPLMQAALEAGWPFQCWTLRERGVVVAGPSPQTLVAPIAPQDMAAASAAIAEEWYAAARHDPAWLVWLRQRRNHAFVVQTLCRMLYTLASGEVASKPRATQWAQQALGAPWPALVQRSCAARPRAGQITQSEESDTLAFLDYTAKECRRGA